MITISRAFEGAPYKPDALSAVVDFGLICVDNPKMKQWLFRTFTYLPAKIVDELENKCCFLAQDSNGGSQIPKELTKDKEILLFSDRMLDDRAPLEILYTIAHECAHAILGHRSQLLDGMSEEETIEQELNADKLACAWTGITTTKNVDRAPKHGFAYEFEVIDGPDLCQ